MSELDEAIDELVTALGDAKEFVRQHQFFEDPENRAAGYAFLVSMLIERLEDRVVFDPDYPFFHILDPRIRAGGDNADQRYLISTLRGGEPYRIWGTLGSADRLDVQAYAGSPYLFGDQGRMASFLNFEDIDFDDGGSFEVVLGPEPRANNWLENPPDGTRVLVRQIFSVWSHEPPGSVHIDRVGSEGSLKPRLSDTDMGARLRAAGLDLRAHVGVWPEFVVRYMQSHPHNTLVDPYDPGSLGGVPGRWMSHGYFELEPDDALIIRTWPASGNYQGIQLTDVWFSSLEYANRQSSLTGDQAYLSQDGSYYFVVTGRDPGFANWLDTMGRRQGAILLRYDGMIESTFEKDRYPTATLVKVGDLGSVVPADMPVLSPEERSSAIAARRRHVQVRFGF